MEQDNLIDSIELQNDEYSKITITMSNETTSMNEEELAGRMRDIGESMRSGAAGILYDGADDRLSLIELENTEGKILAYYDSREREGGLIMD